MEQSINQEKSKLQTALNQDMTQELPTQEVKVQWLPKPQELGFIDKGTGKHQSNIIYDTNGLAPCNVASFGCKQPPTMIKEVKQCKND